MLLPVSVVPFLTSQRVPRVEEISELDPSKFGNPQHRRGLHLDSNTTLIPPPSRSGACLAVDRISRPGLANHIWNLAFPKDCFDAVQDMRGNFDLATWR